MQVTPTSRGQAVTARPKLRAIAAMLALATTPSHGLWLGEPLVRSHLGEPLRVDIPYRLEEGETIDDRCLTLGGQNVQTADGLDFLQRGRIRLVEYGLERAILVTTQQAQGEPVVKARLQVDCGAKVNLARDYTWLLDPPTVGSDAEQANVPPMPALSVETAAAALPVRAEPATHADSNAPAAEKATEPVSVDKADAAPRRRIVAPGETLADVARELAPNDAAKQAEIVKAIVAANPELFSSTPANEIHAGTELKLPDPTASTVASTTAERHDTKRASRRARAEARRAARLAAGERAHAPTVALPVSDLDRSVDAAAIEAHKAMTETRKTLAEAKRIGAGGALPGAPAERPVVGTPTRREGQYQFALSLSRVDESAVPHPRTAAERRARDEANEDDRQATILALREQVKNLQNEIASLQALASGRTAGVPVGAPVPQAPSASVAPPAAVTLAVPQPPKPTIVPPLKERLKSKSVAATAPANDWTDAMWKWLARLGLPVGMAGAIGLGLIAWRRRSKSFDSEYPVTIPPMSASANEPNMGDDVPASVKAADLRPSLPAVTETDLAFIPASQPDQRIVSREQRLAYLAERFPEVAHGDLSMDDEDAVIEASRIYFEGDGETDKAVELLEFSIADEPARVKPWLAEFEILRRASRAAAFEKLAARYHAQFGENEYWREICVAGGELLPGNEQFAAGSTPTAAEQDEWAAADAENMPQSGEGEGRDNWLNAPLDFTPELLASDLRDNLLADFRDEEPSPAKEPPAATETSPAKKEPKAPLKMADQGEAVGN